ncbi:MAG: hypothetical protein GXO96_06530, partial [Nitrospirae bacterium]|nr:hypothetical protein [Candidatus Manganitrophaceae bacterium]
VQTLKKNAPNVLKRLMQSLSRETTALQRWVRHFDDVILSELCRLAQPLQASDSILFVQTHFTVLTLLKTPSLSPGLTERKRRTLFWEEMLRVSYATQGSTPLQLFWKDVLIRVAGRFQCSVKALMDALWQVLSSSKAHAGSEMIK